MKIGIPNEWHFEEPRIALAPVSVRSLVQQGHEVYLEKDAGINAGFPDEEYKNAGAEIVPSSEKLYQISKLIVKVNDFASVDAELASQDHIILSFFHFMARPELANMMAKTKSSCISYDKVSENNDFYILRAMSEIGGKMAFYKATEAMQFGHKSKGLLLVGLPGIRPPVVMVIGAGNAGLSATEAAVRAGCRVYLFDKDPQKLNRAFYRLGPHVTTLPASDYQIRSILPEADVVIGAVRLPDDKSPMILTADHMQLLTPGTVVVDLSIDQGGCFETSRATAIDEPFYTYKNIIHCAVPNLPGLVPRTSSLALNGAVYSLVLRLSKYGLDHCVRNYADIREGIQYLYGRVVNKELAAKNQQQLFSLDSLTIE
jgi:alanine dehydrogenase